MLRTALCILSSNGQVFCVPPYDHVVICSADLTLWPYDTHTCTMEIGSWNHMSEQLNISLLEPGVRIRPKQFCQSSESSASAVTNRFGERAMSEIAFL
jgi:hypothetical protein